MTKTLQKRTLETRARLIAAAEEVIGEVGYAGLRVEEVVKRAGTAKGTFFAHFKDKDVLMDRILGARLHACLDEMAAGPRPTTIPGLMAALMPLARLMTCERYVFDVILRYSGAASVTEIGPIAETFGRQVALIEDWLGDMPCRPDIPAELRAEGVHAMLMQAMSVSFCALHSATAIEERLGPYLQAWLAPGKAA